MIAQTYHDSGWPRLIDNAAGIWSQIAFVPQPQRVRFPLLFQAAENEYLAMVGSHTALRQSGMPRSEARRVGNECVSTCRYRWSPYIYKKKEINRKGRIKS